MSLKNNPVIIFSNNSDASTLQVIKWLKFHSSKFYLIKNISDLNKYNIQLTEEYISKNIHAIWYRKLHLEVSNIKCDYKEAKSSITNFLQAELEYFYYSIENVCRKIKNLGAGFTKMDLNKVMVLNTAQKNTLTIPEFRIVYSKNELEMFKKKHNRIISKPIFNARPIKLSKLNSGVMYTKIIDDILIDKLPSTFAPSFLQEYIEKAYELRVFYIDGKFYSSAIFTVNSSENIDYRDKDNNDVRIVPYKLPIEIEKKLTCLMNELGLNTGSIDMIKSIKGEYVFLEINPSGQYEAVSINCNYNLNNIIAKWIAK